MCHTKFFSALAQLQSVIKTNLIKCIQCNKNMNLGLDLGPDFQVKKREIQHFSEFLYSSVMKQNKGHLEWFDVKVVLENDTKSDFFTMLLMGTKGHDVYNVSEFLYVTL